jgi:hypothetical protein
VNEKKEGDDVLKPIGCLVGSWTTRISDADLGRQQCEARVKCKNWDNLEVRRVKSKSGEMM